MSGKQGTISFKDVEAWQGQKENVNNILKKYTGTSEYPSTRSLPPMIFGVELAADAINELDALPGVKFLSPNE
ncbi:hypothetical protein N7466_010291 [Penicillium verhagenii]|uniref:uncharacterized protein n=1 Tax=Penicillium verhagenii TaxID=1562060 RepID=UPI00254525A6|nr:uncharacterized protein N7466_010291 [Penicillium verhagenii]KAJ5919348.1 hypothetical protein N7466_010291 [Penicillium verhagenii]